MHAWMFRLLAGLVFAGTFAGSASAQLLDTKAISLAEAKKLVAAAAEKAGELKKPFCIAVLDQGGHLIYFERMDGAQWASVRIAMAKARTAAGFQRPSKAFGDRMAAGDTYLLGLPGIVPSEGGVPLEAGGQVIGAIGASGGTAQEDGQVASAGAAALK